MRLRLTAAYVARAWKAAVIDPSTTEAYDPGDWTRKVEAVSETEPFLN